jgi:hypothetical protein
MDGRERRKEGVEISAIIDFADVLPKPAFDRWTGWKSGPQAESLPHKGCG